MTKKKVAKRKIKGKGGKLPTLRTYGKTEFWWDHHHLKMAVVVECDDPNYPVIKIFKYKTTVERIIFETRAAKLVERIKSGKVDYRRMSTRVPRPFQWDRSYLGNRG